MADLNLELYKKLLLIRRSEEIIIENYKDDEMKTPMHMSMGGEAIPVGVCTALNQNDQVFGTYRSHALYFAKGGDINCFFAEMYGKITGVAKGKGGSMHLSYPEKNFLATSAVVGTTIPVGVGAAYANRIKKNKRLVAVFFGDGAIDEGAFWESLNLACVLVLPIIFVCEDNSFAVHTPAHARHGYREISEVVSKFKCKVLQTDSTDAREIFELTKNAIKILERHRAPVFMHLKYYRYLEHVGVYEDFSAGYRSKREFDKWFKKDPIKMMAKRLIEDGYNKEELLKIDNKIKDDTVSALRFAKKSKFPKASELLKDTFYEKETRD